MANNIAKNPKKSINRGINSVVESRYGGIIILTTISKTAETQRYNA